MKDCREPYPNIDMQKTGKRIRYLAENAGYNPRAIQEYLHLSCVQPIYRWYKGLILPSVDHLFMLSNLLGVHMEDLIVKKKVFITTKVDMNYPERTLNLLEAYVGKLHMQVV